MGLAFQYCNKTICEDPLGQCAVVVEVQKCLCRFCNSRFRIVYTVHANLASDSSILFHSSNIFLSTLPFSSSPFPHSSFPTILKHPLPNLPSHEVSSLMVHQASPNSFLFRLISTQHPIHPTPPPSLSTTSHAVHVMLHHTNSLSTSPGIIHQLSLIISCFPQVVPCTFVVHQALACLGIAPTSIVSLNLPLILWQSALLLPQSIKGVLISVSIFTDFGALIGAVRCVGSC